jgi:hypothetical protein
MGSTTAAFVAMLGLALVITALTLPGRQSPAVINSSGNAISKITLSSLGIA